MTEFYEGIADWWPVISPVATCYVRTSREFPTILRKLRRKKGRGRDGKDPGPTMGVTALYQQRRDNRRRAGNETTGESVGPGPRMAHPMYPSPYADKQKGPRPRIAPVR